jgi:hypothetical protein
MRVGLLATQEGQSRFAILYDAQLDREGNLFQGFLREAYITWVIFN